MRSLVAAVAVVSFLLWRFVTPSPPVAQDRVETLASWADESRCVECHREAETFWQTGHARTLEPASSESSLALLARLSEAAGPRAEGLAVALPPVGTEALPQVVIEEDGPPRAATLDWCFGSGEQARTWVGTIHDAWGTTDLLEFRWTWYRASDDFSLTPGQKAEPAPGYYHGLGVLYDHPRGRRCLACHASYLPIEQGQLDATRVHAGVTCQRCHGPQGEHVASGGEVVDRYWHQISREESVARCAQCHRRPDEQKPAEIRPDNTALVRFQPVGLTQSACYQQSTELTCVTCHDPHRPLSQQDSLGKWQCVQCHEVDTAASRTACAAGHFDRCVSCHMPKVPSTEHLAFTDHWVRVRETADR